MHKRLRVFEGAGGLVAVLLLFALSMRALVPAGYMPVRAADHLVLSLCSGQGVVPVAVETVRIVPSDAGDDHRDRSGDGAGSCAFVALGAPTLHAATVSVASVMPALMREMALSSPSSFRLTRASFAWPPLRGPPPAP